MQKPLHDLCIARGMGAVERQDEVSRDTAFGAVGHCESWYAVTQFPSWRESDFYVPTVLSGSRSGASRGGDVDVLGRHQFGANIQSLLEIKGTR